MIRIFKFVGEILSKFWAVTLNHRHFGLRVDPVGLVEQSTFDEVVNGRTTSHP